MSLVPHLTALTAQPLMKSLQQVARFGLRARFPGPLFGRLRGPSPALDVLQDRGCRARGDRLGFDLFGFLGFSIATFLALGHLVLQLLSYVEPLEDSPRKAAAKG